MSKTIDDYIVEANAKIAERQSKEDALLTKISEAEETIAEEEAKLAGYKNIDDFDDYADAVLNSKLAIKEAKEVISAAGDVLEEFRKPVAVETIPEFITKRNEILALHNAEKATDASSAKTSYDALLSVLDSMLAKAEKVDSALKLLGLSYGGTGSNGGADKSCGDIASVLRRYADRIEQLGA